MIRTGLRSALLFLFSIPFLMGTCNGDEGKGGEEDGEKKEQNTDLDQGHWQLRSMKHGGKEHSFESPYLLHIKNDSTIELELEVNDCFGSYGTPAPGKIRVESLSCTEMCCDPELAKELARQLPKVEEFGIQGEELHLIGPELRIVGVPAEEGER